jgi:hypothetical protein
VLLAAVLPAFGAANAQDTAWTRVEAPDQYFSIEMPCDQENVLTQEDGATAGLVCLWEGVAFAALVTGDGLRGQFEGTTDIDGMLADAKADPESGRVEMLPGGGGFRIWKQESLSFGVAQISEFRPGAMLVLAVMEDSDQEGGEIDRSVIEPMSERFFQSMNAQGQ